MGWEVGLFFFVITIIVTLLVMLMGERYRKKHGVSLNPIRNIVSDLFYLQDNRSYVGNDLLWWAKDGKGYTTDLSNAETYSRQEAVNQNRSRETDVPWPKAYVDTKIRPAVDMQHVDIETALQNTGIELYKTSKPKREKYKCQECGQFVSEKDFYANCHHGYPCSKCNEKL